VNDDSAYINCPKNYHARKFQSHTIAHHAYIYGSEASHSRHSASHAKPAEMHKKKIIDASTGPHLAFKTFDASYVLASKSNKVVAKYVGSRNKSPKNCVWVPKVLVSNVKGPKTIWVPKNNA
jgi:hypothetical protein